MLRELVQGFRPSVYPQENSADLIEKKEAENLNTFLNAYSVAIGGPIVLQDHVGTIRCASSRKDQMVRAKSLRDYVDNPSVGIGDYCWGRTILSEVLMADLVARLFADRLRQRGYMVMLCPGTLDKSRSFPDPHQKGADFMIVDTRKKRSKTMGMGVCGIDVTTGSSSFVAQKIARPGYQERTAMPVLVLPIKYILAQFGDNGEKMILAIDNFGRQSVKERAEASLIYSMQRNEYQFWRMGLSKTLQSAIDWCRDSLKNGGANFTNYAYSKHILELLSICSDLFQ